MNKGQRLTQRARHILSMAQEEAERMMHQEIGVEHLLVAMMREGGGPGWQAMRNMGVDIKNVEELVLSLSLPNRHVDAPPLKLSVGAKKVLDLAEGEARGLGNHYIGTEHIALGIMRYRVMEIISVPVKSEIGGYDGRKIPTAR